MRCENLRRRISRVAVTICITAFFIVTIVARAAASERGCRNCEKQPSAQPAREAPSAPAHDLNLDRFPLRPFHGGQVTATRWHYFEVVYTPSETRVYVYSPSQRPLNASGVRGEAAMQVNGNPSTFRYPVQAVVDPSGFAYLKADVDVSRVRDGDMQVTFDLRDLPNRQESMVRFTQTFALTRPPAHVPRQAAPAPPRRARVVPVNVTRADEAAIRAQGTCPVMNQPLGSHGAPIKILVDGRPLFVCCQGCVPKVAQTPDLYLEKVYGNHVARPFHESPPQPSGARGAIRARSQERPLRAVVAELTPADEMGIRAQGTCPVMHQPLGAHGTPIKLLVDGRPLYLCCQGCVSKVEQAPERYLSQVRRSP